MCSNVAFVYNLQTTCGSSERKRGSISFRNNTPSETFYDRQSRTVAWTGTHHYANPETREAA